MRFTVRDVGIHGIHKNRVLIGENMRDINGKEFMDLCPHNFVYYLTRHRDDGSIEVHYRCIMCGAKMFDIEWNNV